MIKIGSGASLLPDSIRHNKNHGRLYCQFESCDSISVKVYSNIQIFFPENPFENVVCKISTILFRPQCFMWHSVIQWGGWGGFNIKTPSYQYRKSHYGDKTILRPSYLHNGISYAGKMTSLYWIRVLISMRWKPNGSQSSYIIWYTEHTSIICVTTVIQYIHPSIAHAWYNNPVIVS